MARGMTTVVSQTQPAETISFPVLTYTDAVPRNDMQAQEARQDTGQWDFRQPSPGVGWFRKPAEGTTFDFSITAPPDEAIQTDARPPAEQHAIGIALGSPGLLKQTEALPPPRFDTSIFSENGQGLTHKPSKWKKIGGLFKAKQALTAAGEMHGDAKPPHEHRQAEKARKARERKNSTEEWPSIEIEPPQPRFHESPRRGRKFSLSGNKAPKNQPQPIDPGPLLSVNIPDVQMERYSVMFSDVVNKNQRPPLLARRAKTLDNLQVPDANGFIKAPVPPPMPQRRATSPAHSTFTLFPTSQPSKAAQMLGTQNFSRGPSPLMRANTLPVESPSKQQPRHGSNKNSLSSLESPIIPRMFSAGSSTPRSSSSHSYDKPLPAIRSESQSSHLQRVTQSPRSTPSPRQGRLQSAASQKPLPMKHDAQPRPALQPRKGSLPRPVEKPSLHASPQKVSTHNRIDKWLEQQDPAPTPRPRLRVETENRPAPPAKDIQSSPSLSSLPTLNPTQEKIDRIMSPLSASTGARSGISPSDSTRMPFVDAVETMEPETENPEQEDPEPETLRPIPRVEVSVARSVSVSRAKRHVLVPVGNRVDQLDAEERIVQRRALTPQITDAHRGHRPGISQELRIESQLDQYLRYIDPPSQYGSSATFPTTEQALKDLFRCQITRFPYDNLTCHYSSTQLAEIQPQQIYTKFLGDESTSRRGGYCLEVSIFFHHILRGLGFEVYMTGVRNRLRTDGIPQGDYFGWTHIVNIVRLPSGQEFHLDAAFGGDGPTSPLPLISGQVTRNLGAQEVRLIYDNMPKQTRREQKVWMYQYRNGVEKPWNSFYSFAELEFFQEDFEVMNRFTSWDAVQKRSFIVVKFIRNGEIDGLPLLEGEGETSEDLSIVGKIMMVNDEIKLNMGGRTRVIDSYDTEEGRLVALKKWFGITLCY
ncbi:unnamed protein product [Penicillium olsonii]|nr:unnamed protein product [Penicillium olsonii]